MANTQFKHSLSSIEQAMLNRLIKTYGVQEMLFAMACNCKSKSTREALQAASVQIDNISNATIKSDEIASRAEDVVVV